MTLPGTIILPNFVIHNEGLVIFLQFGIAARGTARENPHLFRSYNCRDKAKIYTRK